MTRMIPWSPFRGTGVAFPATWNEMMNRFFPAAFLESEADDRWIPRMDVRETPEAYLCTCEVPGVRPEEVNVSLTGDTLTFTGERKKEEKTTKDQWHVTERSWGAFQRSFSFPTPVDPDGVDAEVKDGVLTVKVMKSRKSQPKRISVHASK